MLQLKSHLSETNITCFLLLALGSKIAASPFERGRKWLLARQVLDEEGVGAGTG